MRCFPLPNWTVGLMIENVSDARQTAERRKENKKKIDDLLDIVIDKFLDPGQTSTNVLQTLQSMLTFAEDGNSVGQADNSMSITDLIKNLTAAQGADKDHTQFVENFLISYRYFITPKSLLKKLILRYSSLCNSKQENTKHELQKIANVMQVWLKKHFYDFYNDHELMNTIRCFIDTWVTDQLDEKTAHKLKSIIMRNMEVESQKSIASNSSTNSSESEFEFEPQKLNFLEMDPKEVSHQLTLMVFEKFKDVMPLELYNQSWSKEKSKKISSPNVVALIEHFNRISNWIASLVVFTRDLKKRVSLIKYFLQVAEECQVVSGDYETVFMITLGLEQFCVSRLQKTWQQVLADPESARIWSKLQDIISFSQNYRTYRSIYKTSMEEHKQFIPYVGKVLNIGGVDIVGLYLKDLTFIEDGNETISNDVVNFHKMGMIATIIQDIQIIQKRSFYGYKKNPELHQFFSFGLLILSEDDMYEHSKLCEGLGSQTSSPFTMRRGFTVNRNSLRRSQVKNLEYDTSVVVVKNPLFGLDKRKLEHIQGVEKSRRIMQKIVL